MWKGLFLQILNNMNLKQLTTDQLLKLCEIIKDLDGSATGNQVKAKAREELYCRINLSGNEPIPSRTFNRSDTTLRL